MDRRRLSVVANFAGYSDDSENDNQINAEQRRLSEGQFPPSLRRPFPYHYYHCPGEFDDREAYALKRKNSSLNMLLDSTSSIMRTASSTFQCLIGSARRASYCGQLDPSVQLAPNGHCGSLYLRSTTANSNESNLSTASFDEQRRTVTIYDGRVPSTPMPPPIPFELMTPIEAITKARDDPVESFVQIVLEEPDHKPPIIAPLLSSSPTPINISNRFRRRSSSPKSKTIFPRPIVPKEKSELLKLVQHQSMPTTDSSDSTQPYCQSAEMIEPMDFSFLDPVLRGESAAPPLSSTRKHSVSLLNSDFRRISLQNGSTTEDSAIDLSTPSHSPCSSNRTAPIDNELTSSESFSTDNHYYHVPPSPRLKITPSVT